MIKFEDVISVYSGRPGCCCGCRGKHTYRKDMQKEGSRNRGYKVEDSDCSDRTVKMILKKMNANPDTKLNEPFKDHYFLRLPNRLYVAYMKKEMV